MNDNHSAHSSSRGRIIGARVLLVVGILLTVVSILSNYVKREALDESQFKQTSQELIASPAIQEQVAATMVEALYANVDVSGELTASCRRISRASRRRSPASRGSSSTGERRSCSRGRAPSRPSSRSPPFRSGSS